MVNSNPLAIVPVQRLGYVALTVPDPDGSLPFYEEMVGLRLTGAVDELRLLACDDRRANVVLLPGPDADLHHIGLEVTADLDTAAAALEAAGYTVKPGDPADAARYGLAGSYLTLVGPDDLEVRLYNTMTRRGRHQPVDFVSFQRLGHVGIGFGDVAAGHRFFTDALGFRTSDWIGARTALMRCDPYHHSLAVSERKGRCRLHHVNFMVSSIDDIGRAFHRFNHGNVPITFGPGRHPTSNSIFLYFESPDGLTHEYSFGMDQIHDPDHRPRTMVPEPESVCLWGSRPATGAFAGPVPRQGDR